MAGEPLEPHEAREELQEAATRLEQGYEIYRRNRPDTGFRGPLLDIVFRKDDEGEFLLLDGDNRMGKIRYENGEYQRQVRPKPSGMDPYSSGSGTASDEYIQKALDGDIDVFKQAPLA
jgi:hypothetical protein